MDTSPPRPRVLLADDEMLIRELVRDELEEAGYDVAVATSGAEAITQLEQGLDVVGLVTDINFGPPVGWAVATRARELNATVAVIYMTGDSAHEWSAQGVPKSTIVTKPFAPSQIAIALAAQLNVSDGRA